VVQVHAAIGTVLAGPALEAIQAGKAYYGKAPRSAMFPLSRNSVKLTVACALVALAAFATPSGAGERAKNLGPVAAHEPILTTIGNKPTVSAMFRRSFGMLTIWKPNQLLAFGLA
jgi:hypothetical protein